MKSNINKKLPRRLPRLFTIKVIKLNYTIPKLYIPKKEVNGKKVPDLKKKWYVYFYFRNEVTGIYGAKSKFNHHAGINKYKTISGRKNFANLLIETLTEMLQRGYNPYKKTINASRKLAFEATNKTVLEAINQAISDKKNTWAASTAAGIIFRVEKFVEFAKKHEFVYENSTTLKRIHVIEFLKTINARETATSVNNYRSAISSVFAQMVKNNDLEYNFVKDISKEKANPIKNHPFTKKQIAEIKEYLQKNDPYLLQFIRVLAYSFLRNREVIRLQVKDIDLKNNFFSIKTKTKSLDRVYVTDQLREIFSNMELHKYDLDDYVFTPYNKPGKWERDEKGKTDHFGKRFKKVKKKFNLGIEYGIYSFRHSFAINVYENFINSGLTESEAMYKMLPITRHESVDGLGNYLREKKKMLPKDYSHNITIDF